MAESGGDRDPLAELSGSSAGDLEAALGADNRALGKLYSKYSLWLAPLVASRMDRRLKNRISVADVLQEAFLDIARRLPKYATRPDMPFPDWVRFLVMQKLAEFHRRHVGAQKRSAKREFRVDQVEPSGFELAGSFTSPSQVVVKRETAEQLQRALDRLEPIDREVLYLRHFEELTNDEVSELLSLQKSAASNRYIRALKRLRETLGDEFLRSLKRD